MTKMKAKEITGNLVPPVTDDTEGLRWRIEVFHLTVLLRRSPVKIASLVSIVPGVFREEETVRMWNRTVSMDCSIAQEFIV